MIELTEKRILAVEWALRIALVVSLIWSGYYFQDVHEDWRGIEKEIKEKGCVAVPHRWEQNDSPPITKDSQSLPDDFSLNSSSSQSPGG